MLTKAEDKERVRQRVMRPMKAVTECLCRWVCALLLLLGTAGVQTV